MKDNHANTAPSREALAAWDKLHNERETLNQNLDLSNDAAYHQPEGRVSAQTVRELATASILLEQTNTLLDRVSERQSRRPAGKAEEIADTILATASDSGKGDAEQASKVDTDDRVYELQIHLEDIEGVASIVAEACDEAALQGVFNTIERECAAVREGLDDFLGLSGGKAALSAIDRLASEYAEKTPQECRPASAVQLRCCRKPRGQHERGWLYRDENMDAEGNPIFPRRAGILGKPVVGRCVVIVATFRRWRVKRRLIADARQQYREAKRSYRRCPCDATRNDLAVAAQYYASVSTDHKAPLRRGFFFGGPSCEDDFNTTGHAASNAAESTSCRTSAPN